MLIVAEPDAAATAKYQFGRDPSDAPTLALAEAPGIVGIITDDADIKDIGGNVIPLTFKLEARGYSRNAAIQVSLQISGIFVAAGAVEGLILVAKSLAVAIRGIGNLPGWMKVFLAIGSIYLMANPTTRKAIQNSLASSWRAIAEVTPEFLSLVSKLYQEYERVQVKPPTVRYT